MDEIISSIASRSDGSNEFGLGGKAVAEFYREHQPQPDQLLHMLAVALNDIAALTGCAGQHPKDIFGYPLTVTPIA